MKTTPFTNIHTALGARMHPFAGFNMPIEYTGITDEHLTVVQGVGVFDVSHMGEFWVRGPRALAFIQSITSNDASQLSAGKAQYTCFPNDQGGIVDDLLVYAFGPEEFMLVVNAGNITKDWNWCVAHNTAGAELENASDDIAQLAIQGPKAAQVLQRLTAADLSQVPYYSFITAQLAGCNKVIISNTGYTGAGGYELYFSLDQAEKIWNALFEAGKPEGIKPVGLGARDTLRLEMGFCLYGNDIDDSTSPLEGGLGWILKFAEGKNFPGRSVLEKQKADGVSCRLCAFELSERGIPRQGYAIVNAAGEEIGKVTSGTMSPVLKKGIGMGYVALPYALPGTQIGIRIRNKDMQATVVKAPFRK